jgi:5'-nucleotidase
MSFLRLLALTAIAALAAASPAAAHPRRHHGHHHRHHGHHSRHRDVKVQLLAINDLHGALQPTTTGGLKPTAADPAQPAGGAAFLTSYVRDLRAKNRNTLTLAAGDLIGASPLLSALYHDEPTIEAMNLMHLDFSSVGNHEFDEGEDELMRMQHGGCHPVDGCKDGTPFDGANFRYLSANVIDKRTGKPFFRPYAIRRFGGVKVGIIGMTLAGTAGIVSPSGIKDLQFLDEADTANKYAKVLRRRGVKAVVVLLHQGGFQSVPLNATTINGCAGFSGPVTDIVKRTTKAVDVFITGHTHQAYNCDDQIDGRPVTSAANNGRLLTDINLTISRRTRDVTHVDATNIPVFDAGHTPAGDVQALIDRYDQLSAPLRRTPVGRISADITTAPAANKSGENAAGDLIADAQLADTADADRGAAVGALMNPGGVRSNFLFPASGSEGDGVVTYEEAFTVQPFNNIVATQTYTGAQFLDVLKDQWCDGNSSPTVLLPSKSIHYTYDLSTAADILGKPCAGAPNPVSDVTINGTPVTSAGSYRITTNNFLADGGDLFPSLTKGTNRTTLSDFDIDSLVRYMQPSLSGAPIGPPALDRIDTTP